MMFCLTIEFRNFWQKLPLGLSVQRPASRQGFYIDCQARQVSAVKSKNVPQERAPVVQREIVVPEGWGPG